MPKSTRWIIAEEEQDEAANNPLHNITKQQALDYIDNNVNDLASAKQVMKLMVRVLFLLKRRIDNLESD